MKKCKKYAAWILAAGMLCGTLSGCTGDDQANNGESNSLKWYFFSSAVSVNEDEVFTAAEEMVKEKIGADLELLPVESGDYESKMQVLVASQEEFDIMFVFQLAQQLQPKRIQGYAGGAGSLFRRRIPVSEGAASRLLVGCV